MISSIDSGGVKNNKEFDNYKRQAMIVEDKIRQITDGKGLAQQRNPFAENLFERSPVAA